MQNCKTLCFVRVSGSAVQNIFSRREGPRTPRYLPKNRMNVVPTSSSWQRLIGIPIPEAWTALRRFSEISEQIPRDSSTTQTRETSHTRDRRVQSSLSDTRNTSQGRKTDFYFCYWTCLTHAESFKFTPPRSDKLTSLTCHLDSRVDATCIGSRSVLWKAQRSRGTRA